jgi:hypothetical protein
MTLTNAIAGAIEAIIREEFADVEIEAVRVSEALDYQDDRVFNVTVVFDKRETLDPKKTAAIVRHLQTSLNAQGQAIPFPILSFVSKADAARVAA